MQKQNWRVAISGAVCESEGVGDQGWGQVPLEELQEVPSDHGYDFHPHFVS